MSIEIKKFKKGGELYWLLGLLFISLGVALCAKADLGVSMIAAPAFIIHEAIDGLVPAFFTIGVVEYLVQAFFAILLCIVVLKVKISYALTIVVGVIYGYVLDMWLLILGPEPFQQVWLRYVMLIVGDISTAIGVACFFRTYLPIQSYDIFVKDLSLRFKLNINIVKPIYDFSLLAISLVLAFTLFGDVKEFDWSKIYKTSFHCLGLGTIITTVINSPLITLMGKIFDKILGTEPLLPKAKDFLERH
ncbi:MAG: hypothetical protein IJ033_00045 [Clostridia bacterium]|nr:hypothetical protein [Clostridia bacterium]